MIVDKFKSLFAGRLEERPLRPPARANHMKGGNHVLFHNHRPVLREAREDVRIAWPQATARASYAIHNSGYLAGGIDQAVALTAGTGLKLSAKPDHEALGWSQEAARTWAKTVERQFRLWAENPFECDVTGRQTLGQMAVSAFRQWFFFGEIVALLPQIRRPGTSYDVRVMLAPPTRIPQESRPQEGIYQGVRMDRVGLPVSYRMRFTGPSGDRIDQEFTARGPTGRRQVIHVFEGAPGQVRGLTPLSAVLLTARQYDQLADATLTTTLLQTIFAASIESKDIPDDAFDALLTGSEDTIMDQRLSALAEWYREGGIDLGIHGRVTHLFPGDALRFHRSEHPHDNYESFSAGLLREMARAVGCTYEQLTGNYTKATYSSVRMATSEMWQIALQRRENIIAPFMQAAYEVWLEEAIRTQRLGVPGGIAAFYRNKAAISRALWMGPAKPTADDLKTAKARSIEVGNGLKSLRQSVSEEGIDFDDHMEQLMDEVAMFEHAGLVHPLKAGIDVDPSDGMDAGEEA